MRWNGSLGLIEYKKILREGADKVEKIFMELLGIFGLEMWEDIDEVFDSGEDFGAIE